MTDSGLATLAACQANIDAIREHLQPILSKNVSLEEAAEQLSNLDSAKIHFGAAYGLDALFFMYLRLSGINPTTHPVAKELERIKKYTGAINKAAGKTSTKPKEIKLNQASSLQSLKVKPASKEEQSNTNQNESVTTYNNDNNLSNKKIKKKKSKKKGANSKVTEKKRKSLDPLDETRRKKKNKAS